MRKLIFITILIIIFCLTSIYSLDENNYGVITQFGEIVKVVSEPGIHLMIPFAQKLNLVHKTSGLALAELQTYSSDKKTIYVRSWVIWEVSDPALYFANSKSFNASRDLVNEFFVADTKSIFSQTKSSEIILCPGEQETDFCKVDHIIFYHAKNRICKLLEPYGIKITQIDAKAKIEIP